MQRFVTYRRVSTKEQGHSGLGLEAQSRDIGVFLASYAEQPWEVIGEFVDVQSGADDDRPEMAKALELVRKHKATLLVSKLDRLSRRVAFIAPLIADPKVTLRVATMPHADKFQLHLFAALAEQERDFVSMRTKAALAVLKADIAKAKAEGKAPGKTLGGRREKAVAAAAARREQARDREAEAATFARRLKTEGNSLRRIAQVLGEAGHTPANGGAWSATQVKRVLDRSAAAGG